MKANIIKKKRESPKIAKLKSKRYKYSRPGSSDHQTLSSPGAIKFTSSEVNKEVPDTLKINDPRKSYLVTDKLWKETVNLYSMRNDDINNTLRNNKSKLYNSSPGHIKIGRMGGRILLMGMNRFGDTIPAGTVLYRGIPNKHNYLNDPGLQSWTTDLLVALHFAGKRGTVLKYTLKHNIKGVNQNKDGHDLEEEVILKPRNFMKLSERNENFSADDGYYSVKVVDVMRNKKKKPIKIKRKIKK